MSNRDREFYQREYYQKDRSTYEIAASEGTYSNKIRREMQALGLQLRDKSHAQATAIKAGRSKHPTLGKRRDEAVKAKIGKSISENWKSLSPQERKHRSDVAKQQWDNMSPLEKMMFHQSAAEAIRKASVEGSKLERYLLFGLRNAGFQVEFHKKGLLGNDKLHLDLYLPHQKTAIEVDGPSHFFPIWGEDKLTKRILTDHEKKAWLINNGFRMIRVIYTIKNMSENIQRRALNHIMSILNNPGPQYMEVDLGL